MFPRKKGNKYNAISTKVGGVRYDSKMEAGYADTLLWKQKAKEIKGFTRQHKFELYVKGTKVASYKIDFRVECNDGSFDYIEVKGFPTPEWQIKWNLTLALFEDLTDGESARLLLNDKVCKHNRKSFF